MLVVDDEVVRGFVVRALEHAGYQVLQTSGGKEALELMSTTAINVDLLITDLTMPDLSGQDLAERLEHLPVVFISGHPTEVVLAERATAFIQKPFAAGDLVSAIDRLLYQTRGAEIHALADARPILGARSDETSSRLTCNGGCRCFHPPAGIAALDLRGVAVQQSSANLSVPSPDQKVASKLLLRLDQAGPPSRTAP